MREDSRGIVDQVDVLERVAGTTGNDTIRQELEDESTVRAAA